MDLNTYQHQGTQLSPNVNMHSASLNDAMHPANQSVLRNSTSKVSNVQKTSSQDSNSASNKSSSSCKHFQPRGRNAKSAAPILQTADNEVDYYNNPTELFRWINYRRWDGARARVDTNPEESATWVVSRHSTDGRILWRQLPIHLVCMQCGVSLDSQNDENRDASETSQRSTDSDPNAHLKQVEELVGELLEAYPDGAMEQDDQGMLPLHACMNAVNESTAPNERVLFLLVLANATALQIRDAYGRTPIDILKEKDLRMPSVQKALRVLMRAQEMGKQIKYSMMSETNKALSEAEKRSENERLASQRIIHRLEQELAEEQDRSQRELSSAGEVRQTTNILREELRIVKQDYTSVELDLEQARKERDDLVAKTEMLKQQLDSQEDVVAEVKREAEEKIEENEKIVASLRSDASTARAMAQGMESQLRSKFSNAEEMRNTVTQIRKEMANLSTQAKREKKVLLEDIEQLEDELKHVKAYVSELEQKNGTLEACNCELDTHLGQLLVMYNSLSSEYDQLFDSTSRHESSMMESIRGDRSNIVSSLEKQKKMLEAFIAEQERMLTEAAKKESIMSDHFLRAKKRELEAVGEIKENFQEMRTKLSAKHCMITEPVDRGNGSYDVFEDQTKTANLTSSKSRDASPKELNANTVFDHLEATTHAHNQQQQQQQQQQSKAIEANEKGSRENKTPILRSETQPPAIELQKANTEESTRSPGLLSLLEQRAQYSSRRHPSQENGRIFPLPCKSPESLFRSAGSSGRHPSYYAVRESSSSKTISTLHCSGSSHKPVAEKICVSTSKRMIPSPSLAHSNGRSYSTTPENGHKIIRQGQNYPHPADDEDSTTDRYTTSSQKSFSLDEYSDVDSKTSSGLSYFDTGRRQQHRGMRFAVKQDLIRVGSGESNDMTMR